MTDADLLKEAERLQVVLAEHAARHDRETSFPEEGRELIISSPLTRQGIPSPLPMTLFRDRATTMVTLMVTSARRF